MDKRFMLVLVLVIGALLAVFLLAGGKEDNSNATFEGDPTQVQEVDWTQGPSEAAVTLIEFADFQCPGCAALFPALQEVKAEFSEDLRFVFRHFPLVSIHPNAMAAHRAAEAAGRQNKFWEMHNLLYGQQAAWSSSSDAAAIFESYAQQLELNMDQFRSDVVSQEVFDRISRDLDGGNQLQITGTPTLYLNGQKIETPSTAEELKQVIQSAVDSAKQQ